jgi:hypothetical protein
MTKRKAPAPQDAEFTLLPQDEPPPAAKPAPEPAQALAVVEDKPQAVSRAEPSGMGLLERLADRGASLEQMQQFMDLMDRQEKNEARKAFNEAMAGFKAEPVVILKRKKVQFEAGGGEVSYSHAELSDITDAINPLLAKHKLSYSWDIKQEGGMIHVRCILTHVLGHTQEVAMSAPPDQSGKKNTIQQIASATTYLSRYTLLMACGLSTKGMDDDGKGTVEVERITPEQALTIQALVEETGTVPEGFLKWVQSRAKMKVKSYDDIPANIYEEASGFLTAKQRRGGNRDR